MKIKSRWWIISLVIVAIAVMGISTAAMAAGPRNTTTAGTCTGETRGAGWGYGWEDEALTDLLGMTREEICTERLAGKSLVEIAAEKGVSEEELIEAIMTQAETTLQARVEAGTLTQEQAELRLETMRQNISESVNRTTVGPNLNQARSGFGRASDGTGPGQMRQFGRQGGMGRGCF